MKLHLKPNIVYRIPKFPYNASLEECWEELKASIAASSKDFYQQIEHTRAKDIKELPERTQLTIWKYFNRARFRCVPYGSFASVGIFNLHQSKESPMVVSTQRELHQYTDWSAIEKYEPAIDLDQVQLFSNSTWYLTTKGIRYIGKAKDSYELLDNVQDTLVLDILRLCKAQTTLKDLNAQLTEPVALEDLKELIREMIGLQMLFTSAHSNIIGPDYWKKTGYQPQSDEQRYEISIANYLGGTIPDRVFRHVPELAQILEHVVAANSSKPLQSFIEGFQRRFEGKEVPLMVALDPEMGLGYAELESGTEEDEFIAGLAERRIPTEKKDSQVEAFFRRQLGTDAPKVIQLEDLKFDTIKHEEMFPLPNTTSLLCSVADELLIVDLFGGTTANALHGRFSLASEQIKDHCEQLSKLEAQANPDVLFFDIGYQVGSRIDNVNRREQLYSHSISILNYDCSADPLSLNDILVSVSGGRVLLRSKKHNKRLIPRLASAYNYTKADLSVFRFLCELQHQGIQSYLQFSLSSVFKGWSYYPRVQYKNIVVSPAKWLLKKKELFKQGQKDVDLCRELLYRAGVQRYFKHGFSDQTLTYCLESNEDLYAFLSIIEKQEEVELEEVLIGQRADVIDEQSNAYVSQFLLSYYHQQEVYKGFAGSTQEQVLSIKLPGSEWLYFEVFCHPYRSNILLSEYIHSFTKAHSMLIIQWFFIRYTENGPHLRVRFKLSDTSQLHPLLSSFTNLLKPDLESGIVSDIHIRTYKREVHRYGAGMMDMVEQHFCTDSNCVLALLSTQPETEALYQHCIQLIREVSESKAFETVEFEELLIRVSAAYNHEHHLQAAAYRKMNERYKNFNQMPEPTWDENQQYHIRQMSNSLTNTLYSCEVGDKREQLFTDLIHMHVNRLFSSKQRTHEMLMYYYCHKQYISRKMQSKRFPATVQ